MEPLNVFRGSYFGGSFVKISDPNGEIISQDPGNLDFSTTPIPFSFEHVHEAVDAAKRAFASWRRRPADERIGALKKYRDLLAQRREEIARSLTREVGKPLWEAREEVEVSVGLIEVFAEEAARAGKEHRLSLSGEAGTGAVRFQPRGVVAVIAPSNLPLMSAHGHLVPALLCGNTVVLKSGKYAPLVGQAMAEVAHDAGLPAGVFNVVHGDSEMAHRLESHPDVSAVFFTGSFEAGAKIKKSTISDFGKIRILDLSGKNGILIWEDAHYEMALKETLLSAFLTTGQRHTTAGRVLVHTRLFDRFVEDFHELAKKCRIGYGMEEGEKAPFMGPMVSEAAMENYLRYQGMAVREGCEEVMRGKVLERQKKGYYVSPSIHVVTTPNVKSVYQRNELYGPDVALYRVSDLEEATEILNQTQYGLVASIYTAAREHYMRLIEDVQVGLLYWNRPTHDFNYQFPIGGIKKSGNARPMGSFAFHQCTYPMTTLERTEAFNVSSLPRQMPELGGGSHGS